MPLINPSKVTAIIPAAGSGSRMGLPEKKQFLRLGGTPVLRQSVERVLSSGIIGLAVVAVQAEDRERAKALLHGVPAVQVVTGGATRQESVRLALEAVPSDCTWIVIHDAARPEVSPDLIVEVFQEARRCGAALAAVRAHDTVKMVDETRRVCRTLPRERIYMAQTPQVFRRDILARAHLEALAQGWQGTDDANLVERLGNEVRVVEGSVGNIKLTYQADLDRWRGDVPLIGFGYDVHRLQPGRPMFLGGVRIESELGLLGHSDADVLLHAVIDALLGASGAGDIGEHFPPGQSQWKDIRSTELISRCLDIIRTHGYYPDKLDVTVVAELPRLEPYKQAIKERLAGMLGVPVCQVNIKATTEEGMGFTGRGEGIRVYCVASVRRRPQVS